MIQTYKITGMTCNSCRASVEDALNSLELVLNASVDLKNSEAVIQMSRQLPIETLREVLPEKYTISEKTKPNVFDTVTSNTTVEQSDLKQLYPLFLIFLFIIGASALLNFKPWNSTNFMLDFMGLFYVVFSFFKFLDLNGFPESFKMYDPLARVFPFYGWLYPFLELGLGLLFLMRFRITLALIITLIILGITTVGVIQTLFNKKKIQCACLGTALKLPMTKATLIENSIMIVMAITMLIKTYN